MLDDVKKHINKTLPFLAGSKLLLAVSGGIDSMVLVHIFTRLGFNFSIAHCNFTLRDNESDEDEEFIRKYAVESNTELFVTRFNTTGFAKDNKVSVQVAARQLRYLWFNELLAENNIDYLITAHHLDDSLETFLINLSRGTGLDGLTGIPAQNGRIIRPLLLFSRENIQEYAKANAIAWREDSSNASDKYVRNNIRHHIVPGLKSLNTSFNVSFQETLQRLQQSQSLVQDAAVLVYKQIVTDDNNKKCISISKLKRLSNYETYLYQWLSPLGFTAWQDIYSLLNAQSGKTVFSDGFRLLKDRDMLILEPIKPDDIKIYALQEGQHEIVAPVNMQLVTVNKTDVNSYNNIIYVDGAKLKFPLFVRKWQEGDIFYPAGMKGLKKKVSKYFKDEKLSLSEKEDAWLLCSENEIVWIINKRADERFKANNSTTNILKIEVLQK